ncbi:MAG: tripartite tricarboxylate transporter TctB family protein [Rhodocyclales bacterium]|nr:tripartite tricarboxylate transporter TctB family protein [Rhodocyclales bacterium]
MEQENEAARTGLARRWPEAGVALLLMAGGIVVITDSLRVGIGWADDGPLAGYFPFYIGLVLVLASAWNLFQAARHWKKDVVLFATWPELRDVVSMLVPMTIFVVAVAFLGLYLPSALLLAYFMRRHGSFGWLATLAISAGVPVTAFLLFERWFLVPLAKGPIEAWLGF